MNAPLMTSKYRVAVTFADGTLLTVYRGQCRRTAALMSLVVRFVAFIYSSCGA